MSELQEDRLVTCDGFSVDPELLRDAAAKLAELTDALKAHPARDTDCPGSAFGHGGVARATSNFSDGLQRGVETLTADTDQVVNRLRGTANDYTDADLGAKSLLERAANPQIEGSCS